MKTAIQILAPDHLMPVKAHADDAAYDLFANSSAVIRPGDSVMIPTGVTLGLPAGWEAQIVPRSGLAAKHRITVTNSPGTIDAGYRGEIKVLLINHGDREYIVNPYDRIAQMRLKRVEETKLVQVKQLSVTERGESGFGSTGVSAEIEKSPVHHTIARFMYESQTSDPDTHEPVVLAYFKDEASGYIFAVDSSFIQQLEVPMVLEPYHGTQVILKGL